MSEALPECGPAGLGASFCHVLLQHSPPRLTGCTAPPKPTINSFFFSLPEGGSLTPVRDSPCTPRLRSVSSYGNIRAVTTARSLNKSLQNLSLTEECEMLEIGSLGWDSRGFDFLNLYLHRGPTRFSALTASRAVPSAGPEV